MSRVHHTYSPSTLNYRRVCPAWAAWKSSDAGAAQEGTQAHEQVEQAASGPLQTDDEAVRFCVAFVEGRKQELRQAYGSVQEFHEIRLTVKDRQGEELTAGYADCVLIAGKTAELIDYKFGLLPVLPAESNAQLLAYVLGICDRWPEVAAVRAWIVQPRIGFVDSTTWFATESNIEELRAQLAGIIDRAKRADLDEMTWGLEARWKHAKINVTACPYCQHLLHCPEVKRWLPTLKGVPYEMGDAQALLDLSQCKTPQELDKALHYMDWLRRWVNRWWTQVAELLTQKQLPSPVSWRLRFSQRLEVADSVAWAEWLKAHVTPERMLAIIQSLPPAYLQRILRKDGLDIRALEGEILRTAQTKPYLVKTVKQTNYAENEED